MSRSGNTDALPKLERFLTYRLHAINKISDRDTARAYQDECDIGVGEARCLAAIGRFEPLSVNDLARTANLNKGQASRSAQSLVDMKLAQKQASDSDGRGVVLTLTPEGRDRYARVIALIERRNGEIFGSLTPDERRCLGEILDKVLAAQGPDEA